MIAKCRVNPIIMKLFIVLSALAAVSLAKPSGSLVLPLAYSAPLAYAKLVPGAPLGLDGRVVDTPEVSYAKAEHAAAHINEKLNIANEAVKSAGYVYAAPASPLVATTYGAAGPTALTLTKYSAGAPIGLDGRVVDTPEVAHAKAEHAVAHVNEKLVRSKELLRSVDHVAYAAAPILTSAPLVAATYSAPALSLLKHTGGGAPIGLDGRVVDTPEVAYAKAEHAAARINHNIEQGQELLSNSLYSSSPLLVSSYASPAYATGYIQHYY